MSIAYLQISGISVDCRKSKKNIESAEVQLGEVKTSIGRDAGAIKTYEIKFDIPIKLSREDTFSLRLLHKKLIWKDELEEIKFDMNEIFRACGANRIHEYRKSYGRIAIIVTVNLVGNTSAEHSGQSARSSEESLGLHPTTDDIFKICPRFRILVIGKTGVGKSSLINHAFGVQKALASNDKPGEANIETEFISSQNNRFVLHDSKGFEPGEENNVTTVQKFIQQRRDMRDLKDKLHAVWLCFEIPRAGGRLLETGTEDFLRLKRDGQLGNIPVVVVLTKYDMLLGHVDRMLNESDVEELSDDGVEELIKKKADDELKETCIGPLERFAGLAIPYAPVSKKEEHKNMIARLIQITEECVSKHVATEASVMAGVAQRVDPMLNIKTSIEVGKRRYWKALASTAAFKGQTVQACLEVLHTDIVRVWNFQDLHGYLECKEFKALVVKVVDRLDVGSIANPNENIASGFSTVGAIAGIAGPAAPIVLPILATIVIGKWIYDVYQLSRVVLQHFIAYIVDLTFILQTLYLVIGSEELSQRAVELAVASYLQSPTITAVHGRINKYNGPLPLLNRLDRETLTMIEELMNEFSIKASEIPGLRAKIPPIGSQQDEPW